MPRKDYVPDSSAFRTTAISPKLIAVGIGLLLVLLVLVGSCTTVDAGYQGVSVFLGEVNPVSLPEGLHFKMPFIQEIVQIDCREKVVTIESEAASKDLQDVQTTVAVNFSPVRAQIADLFRRIGADREDWERVVFHPAVQECVKQVTAMYTAESLITERVKVKAEIEAAIQERVRAADDGFVDPEDAAAVATAARVGYFTRIKVSITNFSFSRAFNAAIESKEIAKQRVSQAEQELARKKLEFQQLLEQAKQEKEARIEQATGEAKAIELKAVAEASATLKRATAEAEALTKLAAAVDDKALRLRFLQRWDGALPRALAGDDRLLRFLVPLDENK